MKSQLFSTAWSYFKSKLFLTFSEALKAAWKAYKLKVALKTGEVAITFQKASGEITTRIATLNQDLFSYIPKTNGRPSKPDVIRFYSITNESFRACRIERLISFQNQ